MFSVANIYQRNGATSVTDVSVDRLWSFGDSYSDIRRESFKNWAQQLEAKGPVNDLESFAVSGAKAASTSSNSFQRQVDRFISRAQPFAARDLTSVYLGYNDVLNGGSLDSAKTDYRAQIQRLIKNGAIAKDRRIFVATLHDISRAPDPRRATRARVVEWNRFVASVANGNRNIVAVDLGTAFDRILANPTRFGFSDVDTVASTRTSLYADPVHFSERGHRVIAEVYRHYLTRGWDWANTVSAGVDGAARLNQDIDEGVLLSLTGLSERNARLHGFTFGDYADGRSSEHETGDYRQAFGLLEQEGGAGLRYRLSDQHHLGVAVGRYDTGYTGSFGEGGRRGDAASDGVSVFLQQEIGGLHLDTKIVHSVNQHQRRERDALVGEVSKANFNGSTSQISQRVRLPVYTNMVAARGWLVPWAEIMHQQQRIDDHTVTNPFLSDMRYKSDDMVDVTATLGIDAAFDPIAISRDSTFTLKAGLALMQPLQTSDYKVRIIEAAAGGRGQVETIERDAEQTLEFHLSGETSIEDHVNIALDYILSTTASGADRHGLTARLHILF